VKLKTQTLSTGEAAPYELLWCCRLPVRVLTPAIVSTVRHVTGNDQDYLRKIPRAVVQISALL
jgi:hypothetical protein